MGLGKDHPSFLAAEFSFDSQREVAGLVPTVVVGLLQRLASLPAALNYTELLGSGAKDGGSGDNLFGRRHLI